MAPGDLITIDEACERYGLGRTTVWRIVNEEELARYKRVGDRRIYIEASGIEKRGWASHPKAKRLTDPLVLYPVPPRAPKTTRDLRHRAI